VRDGIDGERLVMRSSGSRLVTKRKVAGASVHIGLGTTNYSVPLFDTIM